MYAVQKTILARMVADTALNSALPRDPKDVTLIAPAIFRGVHGKAAPIHPCITYRLPDEKNDQRFAPTEAEGNGQAPIWNETLEIEVWMQTGAALAMDGVVNRLLALFNGASFPLSGGGRVFRSALEMCYRDGYDNGLSVYFALLRFRLYIDTTV